MGGVGVGVARSRGNEPGVGVDQTASTPTPERFLIWDIICLCMREFACTFLEIICGGIVFKFCTYTHICINRVRGAMTFKGRSKGTKRGFAPPPPDAPENGAISVYSSI